MINDLRLKIAAGLMIAVVSVLGEAQAQSAPTHVVRYACDGRQTLVVERDQATAHVRFVDRTYELKRKKSGIGVKYVSPTTALIIDGPTAVFVAEDRLQLGACSEASSIASAR